MALDLLADICIRYAAQARELAAETDNETWEVELLQMAGSTRKYLQIGPSITA